MAADLNASTDPALSVRLRSDRLAAILRVDLIRHHTLVGLVQTWGEEQASEDTVLQLEALAEAVTGPRGECELDGLVELVEDAAAMDAAEIEVGLSDLLRLRGEIDRAIGVLGRFGGRRDRSAA